MAQPTASTTRSDPYRNFGFRLQWDGRPVAGFSTASGLNRTTEGTGFRTGGDPSTVRMSPGQTAYAPITIEHGLTLDPEFERWANTVLDYHNDGGADVSLQDFRKDLVLERYNEAGQLVLACTILRAWPSEFAALPELDADAGAVAIQRLVLQNEGWARDETVGEPADTSFELPQ